MERSGRSKKETMKMTTLDTTHFQYLLPISVYDSISTIPFRKLLSTFHRNRKLRRICTLLFFHFFQGSECERSPTCCDGSCRIAIDCPTELEPPSSEPETRVSSNSNVCVRSPFSLLDSSPPSALGPRYSPLISCAPGCRQIDRTPSTTFSFWSET
jgi:hypothetical protein